MTNHKMGLALPGRQLGGNTTGSKGEHWVPPSALAGTHLALVSRVPSGFTGLDGKEQWTNPTQYLRPDEKMS